MVDKFVALPADNGVIVRYVDQGDGTWALKSVSSATPGPSGGQQVEGTVASGATDTGNPVKMGGVANTGVTYAAGQRTDLQTDTRGSLRVTILGNNNLSSPTVGTPVDGAAQPTGIAAFSYGMYWNGASNDRARGTTVGASVVMKPETSGGCLKAKVIAAATTNATLVKAGPGQVFGGQFLNASAATAYLKLFNKASAPTVGTDIPVDVIGIPAGGRVEISRPLGDAYTVGIAYAITANPADADATAVAASAAVGSFSYI